ncbi:MAG: NYN domain-containing protein [Gracilimonas sp.]
MDEKIRVVAFIDGFNIYHSIDDLEINDHLKWLDIWKMCDSITNNREELKNVYYFTAETYWNREKKGRHTVYMKALEHTGVSIIKGRFTKMTKRDINSGRDVQIYEEKETDINIALQMISGAVEDEYDQAILVTADSDQVPTVKLLRDSFGKEVKLLKPIGRKADELKKHSTFFERINLELLENSQLPDTIKIGNSTITRPDKYKK